MYRLLAAFALCILVATPSKALEISAGDFIDFQADISGVPDVTLGTSSPFFLTQVLFSLDPGGFLPATGSASATAQRSVGTTLGAADIAFLDSAISSTATFSSLIPVVVRSGLGDTIFGRFAVTGGTVDVTGAQFFFSSLDSSDSIIIDVPAVSAVPLPATLVLFLSGLGALGLFGRRRTVG